MLLTGAVDDKVAVCHRPRDADDVTRSVLSPLPVNAAVISPAVQ